MEECSDTRGIKRKAEEVEASSSTLTTTTTTTTTEGGGIDQQQQLFDDLYAVPFVNQDSLNGSSSLDESRPSEPSETKKQKVEGALTPDTIRAMKLPTLKHELRTRGLKVSGNKPELILRLLAATGDPEAGAASGGGGTSSSTPSSSSSSASPPRRKSQIKSQLLQAGVSEQDIGNTDLQAVRKELNGFVKDIARMVNLDWHDGYEEQAEGVSDYFHALRAPAQSVYNMSVLHHTGFDRCHEIMKVIADTWVNMGTIPFRCGLDDQFDSGDDTITISIQDQQQMTFSTPDAVVGFVWRQMLAAAASVPSVDDSMLLRYIKDAVDHGCLVSDFESEEGEQLVGGGEKGGTTTTTTTSGENGEEAKEKEKTGTLRNPPGKQRLLALYESGGWRTLPTTAKKHKQRRAIDRRFSGPKHLRTRDFGSDSEGEERCLIS